MVAGIGSLLALGLSGCATRPGPEVLVPVTNRAVQVDDVTVLSVTNRAPLQTPVLAYGAGRGRLSYEEFRLQPSAARVSSGSSAPFATQRGNAFVTVGRRSLDGGSFLKTVERMRGTQGDTVVVFVHGYNNSYQEAVFQLGQLSAGGRADHVPILFSWPSQAELQGYVSDRDAVTYARDDLAQLLTSLSKSRPGGRIVVAGHSMGAWLVMETLRQLRLQRRDDVLASLQVGLAAPDIDMDVFKAQASVVGRLSPPLTVLVSPDDQALTASSRIAGNRPRLGAVRVDDPEIQDLTNRGGIRIIDISNMPSSNGFNHDRFIAFAALAAKVGHDGELPGFENPGSYLLDDAGRALAAPFAALTSARAEPRSSRRDVERAP